MYFTFTRLLGKPDATAVRVFKKKGSGNFNAGNSFQNDNIRENEDYKYGTNFEGSQKPASYDVYNEDSFVKNKEDDFQNSDTFPNNGAKQSINDYQQSNSGAFSQNKDEYQTAQVQNTNEREQFSNNDDYEYQNAFSDVESDFSTGQTDQQRTEEKLRNSTSTNFY